MNPQPTISLVTPSRNQQKYLRQCLAIVSQHQVQHIVADGASDDGSLTVLQQHSANTSSNFEYLSQQDQGMYQALNRGFAQAEGDIFGYINCDDVLLPWATEMVRDRFAQNPLVDILVGDALEFYPAENRAALVIHPPAKLLKRYLYDGGFLAQPAVFFRHHVYEKLGGFDENLKLLGDHDFWLRAQQAGFRFGRLWEFLAIQRMIPGQLMQAQQAQAQNETRSIRNQLALGTLGNSQKLHSRALYALLHRVALLRLLVARELGQSHFSGPWSLSLNSGLLELENFKRVLQTMFASSRQKRYLQVKLDAIGLEALQDEPSS